MVAMREILVVDDEPTITESCRRVLENDGYKVDAAESGQEGLNQALSKHFDVVMTDLRMPELDGMDLVRTLRRQWP